MEELLNKQTKRQAFETPAKQQKSPNECISILTASTAASLTTGKEMQIFQNGSPKKEFCSNLIEVIESCFEKSDSEEFCDKRLEKRIGEIKEEPYQSFIPSIRAGIKSLIENDNIYTLRKTLEDYFIKHMKAPDLKNDFENEFNHLTSILLCESAWDELIVEREHELETEFNSFYNDILIRDQKLFIVLELKQVRFTSIIDPLIKYFEEKEPSSDISIRLKAYVDTNTKLVENYKLYNEVFYGPNCIKNKWIMELSVSKFLDEEREPHDNIKIKAIPSLYKKKTKLYRKLILEKYKTSGRVEIYYLIRIGPSKIVAFYQCE